MMSPKSIGCRRATETFTIRAGALFFDKGQQQRGKQKPGEIIHRKAQIEPLGAGLAGTSGADARHC